MTIQEHREREQLLIDMMFSFAMRIHANDRVPHEREKLTEWMRENLRSCGFNVTALGSSHAVLVTYP